METTVLAVVGWVGGLLLSHLALAVIDWTLFAPRGHDLIVTWAPAMLVLPVPISAIAFTMLSARRVFSRLDAVAIVEKGEAGAGGEARRGLTTSQARPLSPMTFFRRHRRQAVLLTGAMCLVIVAVALIIFVFASVFDAQEAMLGELLVVSTVEPVPGSRVDPGIVSQVRTHPAVERAMPFVRHFLMDVFIPPFAYSAIPSYGLYEEDLASVVELYGLELEEGWLPRPNTNEVVISHAVAQNRDLEVGDVIGDLDRPAYTGAPSLPTEFVISGIFAEPAAGEENWLSFISLEFIEGHEAYGIPPGAVLPLIVVPRAGQRDVLDDWLESEIASSDVHVRTYRQQYARHQERLRSILMTMALIEIVITVVTAAALAALNYLSVSQRQSEFGVLSALGYGRWWIVGRILRETVSITGAAWAISLTSCFLAMLVFQLLVFAPLGLKLNLLNPTPWLFTLPTPVAVLIVTGGTVARTLSKLDPVAVIERR